MEKHIKCYGKDGKVIFSGYVNIDKVEVEKTGDDTLVHIWSMDRFIGIISCNRYELGGAI